MVGSDGEGQKSGMEAKALDEQKKSLILLQFSALSWALPLRPLFNIRPQTVSHRACWFVNYWGPFQRESSWVGKYCSEDVKESMQHLPGAPQSGTPLQGTTLSLEPGGEGIAGWAKGKPQWGDGA